jgi:zinc transporter, ZIP family
MSRAYDSRAGRGLAVRRGPSSVVTRAYRPGVVTELAVLALAGSATALATGFGALPVSRLGARAHTLRPALWGLTVGLMTVASIVGLLLPALDEGPTTSVAAGLAVGVAFLLLSRELLEARDVHVGALSGAGVRRSILVFAVLFVHSLPEGFAIGTAYASDTKGLGLFVILAIALQNVPEGTSVAIPMEAAGFSPRQQFWAAVLTSAPQPVGALVAYGLVEEIEGLLPFSFGFAAGAMLCLVVVELVPEAFKRETLSASLAGTAAGALLMLALAAVLGV